jgi:hypothetical protein
VAGVFTPVLTKRARRGRTVGKAFMARLRSATEWPERLRRLSPGSKKSRILRTRGTVMVKTCTGGKVIIHFAGSWLRRPRSNKRTTLSGAAKICFKSGCFICSVTARDSGPSSGTRTGGKQVRGCRRGTSPKSRETGGTRKTSRPHSQADGCGGNRGPVRRVIYSWQEISWLLSGPARRLHVNDVPKSCSFTVEQVVGLTSA